MAPTGAKKPSTTGAAAASTSKSTTARKSTAAPAKPTTTTTTAAAAAASTATAAMAAASWETAVGANRPALVESVQELVRAEKAVLEAQLATATSALAEMRSRMQEVQAAAASDAAVAAAVTRPSSILRLGAAAAGAGGVGSGNSGRSMTVNDIHTLDMSNGRMAPEAIVVMCRSEAGWIPGLNALSLVNCNLSDVQAPVLGDLCGITRLRSLNLSNNDLGDKSLLVLARAVRANPHLTGLDITRNMQLTSYSSLRPLFDEALPRAAGLVHLALSIDDRQATDAATDGAATPAAGAKVTFGASTTSRGAKVSSRPSTATGRSASTPRDARPSSAATAATSGPGAAAAGSKSSGKSASGALADALDAYKKLGSLSLYGSRLARSNLGRIMSSKSLTSLDLSCCFIGALGALTVATSLPKCPALIHLSLKYCGLSDGAMVPMWEALQCGVNQNQSLTSLDLSYNDLTNACLGPLQELSLCNPILFRIDLSHTAMTSAAGPGLVRILEDAPVLSSVGTELLVGVAVSKSLEAISQRKRSVAQPSTTASPTTITAPVRSILTRRSYELPVCAGAAAAAGDVVHQPSAYLASLDVPLAGQFIAEWCLLFASTTVEMACHWQLVLTTWGTPKVIASGSLAEGRPARDRVTEGIEFDPASLLPGNDVVRISAPIIRHVRIPPEAQDVSASLRSTTAAVHSALWFSVPLTVATPATLQLVAWGAMTMDDPVVHLVHSSVAHLLQFDVLPAEPPSRQLVSPPLVTVATPQLMDQLAAW